MITNANVYPMAGARGGHNPAAPMRHPRILTDAAVGRLQALNAAVRRLREWRLEIAEQRIDGPAGKPFVRITCPANVSMAPLLDATHDRRWLTITPQPTRMTATLDGVQIEWEVH